MGNLRENILGSVGIIFWKRYAKLSNTHLIYSTYYFTIKIFWQLHCLPKIFKCYHLPLKCLFTLEFVKTICEVCDPWIEFEKILLAWYRPTWKNHWLFTDIKHQNQNSASSSSRWRSNGTSASFITPKLSLIYSLEVFAVSYEGVISFLDFQPSHAAPKGLVKLMILLLKIVGFVKKKR